MKTYKGYELIKEIAQGNIKTGTKIKVHTSYGSTIDYWFWGNWFGKEDGYSKPMDNIELFLCDKENEFELIEEQEEIDIQSIQDLDINEENVTKGNIIDAINDLVIGLKQLDKKIKEM